MDKMKTYVITLSRVFPKGHPRAGEPTGFEEKLLLQKRHTIRANYPLWEKRIKQIKDGEACLSIREWTGKPYRSKQRELARLTQYSGIDIEKLSMRDLSRPGKVTYEEIETEVELPLLAENDGLSFNDFYYWFRNYNLKAPLAIIHFTPYRYWI